MTPALPDREVLTVREVAAWQAVLAKVPAVQP